MNVHAQVPGHVPNQGGPQPPGLAPQNAGSLPPQMQGVGAVSNMDPDMLVHRKLVCDKITQIFHLKRPNAELSQRLPDIVRRLEERLYRSAMSKDDYLNMATLESRLQAILRSLPNSQPPAHPISSSSPVSTMIRTPGISHGNGSNTVVPSSLNNSVSTFSGSASTAPTVVITGDMLSSANGSLSSGYRQAPANVSAMSSGTNMMSSRGVPQLSSQMIPTPGLNVPQSLPMNSECGSTGGRFPSVQSSILSQQQQQQQQPWHHLQQPHEQDKQYLENQNSSMLHGIRTHIGADLRPDVQQRPSSYRSSNGIVNGGGALVGKNAQIMNGPLASDGYLSATPYGASPRPLQKHIEQQQHQPILSVSSSRQVMPVSRDGYGVNAAELSGAGNLYDLATTVGTTINRQNMNSMNLQPKNKMYPLQGDQQNLQLMQQISHLKPPSFDHSQKMNFHSVHTTGDHLQSQQKMQKFQQQQQFQEQPDQPYGQVVQLQQQQKQIQQHQQHMLKNDALRQSTLASNFEGQMTSDQGMNACPEPLPTQAPEQFQVSEFQSQHQPNSTAEDHSKGTFIHFSEPQGFNLPFAQGSQRMHQIFHPLNQGSESQNEVNSLSTSSRSELLRGQWHPQALQKSQTLDVSSFEQHFQVDFHQRITGQDEAQQPHFSSEGSVTSHSVAATSATVPQLTCGGCEMKKSLRERQYLNQQRWLLFLLHARCCPSPKGKCQEVNCITVQHLLSHMRNCKVDQCGYPRCCQSKALIKHYRSCRAGDCPVCVPVRLYTTKQRKLSVHPTPNADFVNSGNASWKTMNDADADRSMQSKGISTRESSVDLQSSFKRMKVDLPSSAIAHSQSHLASASLMNPSHSSQEVKTQGHQQVSRTLMTKMEIVEMKTESLIPSELENPHNLTHSNMDVSEDVYSSRPDAENVLSKVHDSNKKTESMLIDGQTDQATVNIKQEASAPVPDAVATKSGKPKIKGVSMTELFTPDQIREHIFSLRQWVGQSKAKAEKNQAMERSMSENSCQLCAVEKLTFEPPPIYCSPCGARIKRNATYYTIGMGETRHYFCTPCYHEARGDSIEAEGTACPKSKLEKKKNDEETEEAWVLCDKCEAWQHQICALFNGRRNDGEAEYTCPNCYVQEIERGERMPLPQSAVLGAKDLPRTLLSDHIEQRLFKRLKLEKQERARHLGKNIDEVPGAEALVVRVVSSVDKKLEVKQRFLEMFQEENYPAEFPYKSKVILLFQRIDGVEVCLFGMYVQEFGTECPFPNQRRVYLSYLDSVKYFRPEIKTITGEALRTFVYHEILIGYLEYCKKRGFTSCYIWACPPLKGEDYILYCHPEIQKTPKSDKLREWYLSMLRKAMKEEIVVDLTNLYDNFFVPIGECKAKVTAARLPYFDGDYWPGAAEDMINQLQQEEDGRKQQKKGKAKKIITKRSLKATCQADLSSNASKDILLMQKLGDTISPMKEDFIMVHLQHACTHCCVLMVSGIRWVCNQCKNFQLCDKCYNVEQRREDRERHPIGSKEKHLLRPVEINDVAMDTKDKDEIIESEFFGTRQAFLSLCQGNHYQYDTLRRAKHSSMMVLFHLHNPTEPAFVTTCNVCHHDIESGQGWRCEVCLDFDVCNKCYQRDGGVDHPHRLTNHPSMADRDAQTKEARQKRVLQLRKMLDLLVHASQCRSLHCQYPNCRGVKKLFRHGINCKQRASGGCPQCKRMWELLQLHARACKESQCHVPRCRDLRDHFRRLQQQSDSRRRAAVLEMIMRQRAAEVAESGG